MAQCHLNTLPTETIDLEAEDLYRQPIVSKVMTNIAEGTINFLAHFWRISTMLKGIFKYDLEDSCLTKLATLLATVAPFFCVMQAPSHGDEPRHSGSTEPPSKPPGRKGAGLVRGPALNTAAFFTWK